jgi:hypothetical protein
MAPRAVAFQHFGGEGHVHVVGLGDACGAQRLDSTGSTSLGDSGSGSSTDGWPTGAAWGDDGGSCAEWSSDSDRDATPRQAAPPRCEGAAPVSPHSPRDFRWAFDMAEALWGGAELAFGASLAFVEEEYMPFLKEGYLPLPTRPCLDEEEEEFEPVDPPITALPGPFWAASPPPSTPQHALTIPVRLRSQSSDGDSTWTRRRVSFGSPLSSPHAITPYSSIYQAHPSTFDFDASGGKIWRQCETESPMNLITSLSL